MTHISDYDLIRLAEITDEGLVYSNEDLALMDHLKTCSSCYEKFCTSLALVQTMSEEGGLILSDVFKMEYANSLFAKAINKVLAVVDLARSRLSERINVIMNQADSIGAALRFQPSMVGAGRGVSDSEAQVFRFEDTNDDKSCIVYDPEYNELFIQINTKEHACSGIRIRLELDNGDEMIVQVEKKGKIYKGVVKEIPSEKFRIIIEADD